ncbi:hypothetical protein [Mesorhizobium humile]|uniref:Uncharacterized protein n=1 Tax=Mesorhizobium humile TaxID=3072313 RepID=A0ABU4YB46_9HYPH|nr:MULTISPECIES: hypothetical protein [unclassified Mesorhizobium]MDX8458524.1 hypothetical protein [Mesorhizobium sp. VK2D]MDX8483936.1 hypothetical protein [Mesorhizobium sp. VK2B]
MIVGVIAKHHDLRARSALFEAKLLLRCQKTMLQRTFLPNPVGFKSINELPYLTPRQFNGEIKAAKALWKSLRKVAVALSLSHSSAGVGGRNGGFVRTVSTLGGLR